MAALDWVRKLLDDSHVAYQALSHPRAVTASELAQKEHTPGSRVAKVVVLIADGKPVELVLGADHRVNLHAARLTLGAREARLASEPEMASVFGDCQLGAEPPLRHWGAVEIWMDESLRTDGEIVFAAGTHEDGIRMRFADWFRLVEPKAGSFVQVY